MRLVRLVGFCISVFFLSSGAALYAQDASVIGTVTDETKAVLPGVTMTATNARNRRAARSPSPSERASTACRLPAGTYKLQAELAGFATVLLPGSSCSSARTRPCRSR